MITNNKPSSSKQSTSQMQTYSIGHNSPKINIKRLNLHSASRIHLFNNVNTNQLFLKNARVVVSPLRHTLLNNYTNPALSNSSHPKVTKCNSNRCLCCRFLNTGSTVSSFVNNRTFSCLLPHNSS